MSLPQRVLPNWANWEQCQASAAGAPGCLGRQVGPQQPCFAHTATSNRAVLLSRIRDGGALDFLQGVELSDELLAEVLEAAPTRDGRIVLSDVRFNCALFRGNMGFAGVVFRGNAEFRGATFQGNAWFNEVTFQGNAWFDEAAFQGHVGFEHADFQRRADFLDVTFHGNDWFSNAEFRNEALFGGSRLQGDMWFRSARFGADADFNDLRCERALDFGPVAVTGRMVLDRAAFSRAVQLQAKAVQISCVGAHFLSGGHLRLQCTEAAMDDAEVTAPLIVSQGPQAPDGSRSALTSLRRANVEKLTITDLDLRTCRFAGAHHLDQLVLNTTDAFHRAPARRGRGRQVLAEECAWRRTRPGRGAHRWPDVGRPDDPQPAEVANSYRQLRKGREDAKNEPGAADFYYGECEMRRHDAGTPLAEKAILTGYWLISGYGLRASRALLALLTVLVLSVGLLMLYGLQQDLSPPVAASLQGRMAGGQTVALVVTSLSSPPVPTNRIANRWSWRRFERSSRISLNALAFRAAEPQQLTVPGRYIEMAARVLGPVLLALAFLAVRNRVKR